MSEALSSGAHAETLADIRANAHRPAYQIVRLLRSKHAFQAAEKLAEKIAPTMRYGNPMCPAPHYGRMIDAEPIAIGGMHWSTVDRTFEAALSDDIDTVVEIGAGSGHCTIQLALNSGQGDRRFFATDIEVNAQQCVTELAGIAGLDNVRPAWLDIREPDLSFLRGAKRVLVISHIALVYGTNGSRLLWDRLAAIAPFRACLFETVSFAIPELEEPPLFSKERAELYGHDLGVYPRIIELAQAKRLRLIEIVPDMTGLNQNSAATLLRFESLPGESAL